MNYEIALIGAGNLGSRYLQGIANCSLPLSINVVDPSQNSLEIAHNRWKEVNKFENIHKVRFIHNLKKIKKKSIDIVIVSTNSRGRAKIIEELSNNFNIRYWILEKVLAQNENELNLISTCLEDSKGAWVNTNRRVMKWYQEIFQSLTTKSPLHISVYGSDWGLACNAIHFLDLAQWLTCEELLSINTNYLDHKWHKAKRKGYWEIFGTLKATFSNGSKLVLESSQGIKDYEIKIDTADCSWVINESIGVAKNSNGELIKGRLSKQSEITNFLIESILNEGNCDLPKIDESIFLHKKLISALLSDWRSKMSPKQYTLPIT
jgi:hypothetical protein